jgi:hypothetical protein
MRNSTKAVLAAAAVALAGSAAVAATLPAVHHLTVRLPNGGVEQVSYTGDAAPKVTILPASLQAGVLMPAGFWAPFAGFDQISAQMDQMASAMDRQTAIAMRNMDAVALAGSNGLTSATLRGSPAGTESYSMISTMSGSNTCTRDVRIISRGDNVRPEVVSHSSGNCGAANAPGTAAALEGSAAGSQLMKVKTHLPAQPAAARQHI